MATIDKQAAVQPTPKTLRGLGTNKAVAWADEIMVAATGTDSGEDLLSAINRKIEESDLVARGTSTPVPTADTAWIFYRSDDNAFWIKDYDGSTYSYIGPFHRGSYQLRLIYHTADVAPNVRISWNYLNANFNVESGGWTQSDTNAKWLRIVALPATSNTESISPPIRLDNPSAGDIAYSRPASGNFSSSVNNVQEALNEVNAFTLGGGTAPPPAAESEGLLQVEESTSPTYSRHPNRLSLVGDTATFTFNIDSDLRNFSSNYNENLFIEANCKITIEAGGTGVGSYAFDVRDGSGNTFSPAVAGAIALDVSTLEVSGYVRVVGIIPRNTTAIQLRVTVASGSTTTLVAGVDNFRAEIHPDVKADEVVINQDDLGNNIATENLNTLDEVISQVDELPIYPFDAEDVDFPGGQNSIDDDGVEVERTVAIHRNLQNVIDRPDRHYIAQISYDANVVVGSGTAVNFTHNVYLNASNTAVSTQTITGQGVTPTPQKVEVNLPAGTTQIRVGFTSPTGQSDARLAITNYRVDFVDGISPAGFTADGRIIDNNVRSVQDLAQAVYNYVPPSQVDTYHQRVGLNNINITASTIEAIDRPSQQVMLSSSLIDEAGEKLGNPIALTAVYTLDTIPPALTGNIGRLLIRSDDDAGSGTGVNYGEAMISGVAMGDEILVRGVIPQSANMPSSFYVIFELNVAAAAYAVVLDNGFVFAERDLISAIPARNIVVPESAMSSPSDFIGGLREVTGVSGIPDTPANVQDVVTKADYLLRLAYNPYQYTERLDRFDGSGVSGSFPLNSGAARLSNPISIPAELRELSSDVTVRVRVRAQAITTAFRGTAAIRNEANTARIGEPDENAVISGAVLDGGDYLNFERTFAAASIPNTFRVQFERDTGNTGTANIDDASVYIEDSGGAGGMTGGQAGGVVLLWESGPNDTDRTTANSTTVNYDLISGRRFGDYSATVVWYDTDATAAAGLFAYVPQDAINTMITNHGSAGRVGLIVLEAFGAYKLIKPVSNTRFRIYEGSTSVGIRRIYGIP